MGFIDTHSHLWTPRLADRIDELLHAARRAGVENILLCAGGPSNWRLTAEVASEHGLGYLLGVHPLALGEVTPASLGDLRRLCKASLADPAFIGVGEVGLDGLVPGIDQQLAETVLLEEFRIARDLKLPVSLHVRKSASRTLALLRRVAPSGGAVHAFNGSDVEREAFLKLGLRLGFGGAVTYAGSKRIRRHLAELPDGAWLLETDAPDMPGSMRRDAFAAGAGSLETEPADILAVAREAAALRGVTLEHVREASRAAAIEAFPRLAGLLSMPGAFANRRCKRHSSSRSSVSLHDFAVGG